MSLILNGTTGVTLPAGGTGNTAGAVVGTTDTQTLANKTLTDPVINDNGLPVFHCRAWVSFNGTGTVAIRAAGNVTSITDNGTGDYTINFTTPMPDTDYAVLISAREPAKFTQFSGANYTKTTSSVRVLMASWDGAGTTTTLSSDFTHVDVAIFR